MDPEVSVVTHGASPPDRDDPVPRRIVRLHGAGRHGAAARGDRARRRGNVARYRRPRDGPRRGPRSRHLGPGLWRDHQGNGQKPDGRSLLRIGSVSKVFTTELLAGMAAEGQLRLTDLLQQYAVAGVGVPRFGDRPITLLDLAAHSAGLPREIGEVPPDTIPFTWPTKEERWSFLAG